MKRDYIGSSDAATLVGLGEQTREDLKNRILYNAHREVSAETQALFDRGKKTEPKILAAYAAVVGVELERPPTKFHHEFPFLGASPDSTHGRIVVEAKTRLRWAQSAKDPAKKFGWAGSADIPEKYKPQVQWLMEILDAEECRMPVAFGEDTDDGFRIDWVSIYRIPRDREFGADLIRLGVEFWNEEILPFRPQEAA